MMRQPSLFDELTVWTVGELTGRIRALLDREFDQIWVEGEISNLKRASSGHVFFSLKDKEAILKATVWRSTIRKMKFQPENGLSVLVRGRLDVYPPSGEYRLIVDQLQPKGQGAQDLALRQLKEKLARSGFFAPERKKPLPRFPRRIALVTSARGAAIKDMLEVLRRRWPPAEVWVRSVRVQGSGAAEDIAGAVQMVNRIRGIDVVILGRGGGSNEDLAAFNQEIVARAIFHSRIPVISAVGHEIDVTIADLVADCRALTPSNAAELATPEREALLHDLQTTRKRLQNILLQRWQTIRQRFQDLARRRIFQRPLEKIRDLECRLDQIHDRLQRSVTQRIAAAGQALHAQSARLQALSPLNVLARGYSLTRRETDLHLVLSAAQVRPGDRLETLVHEGRILSRIEEIQK